MVFYEPIAVGLGQLRANKLRALLTLLGIVIGVASVIGIVSIGEGLRRSVMGQFAQSGGASSIQVNPPRTYEVKDGRYVQRSWREHLGTGDLRAFRRESEDIQAAVPGISGNAQLRYGKTIVDLQLTGTSEAFSRVNNWPVEKGRGLSAEDVRQARRVCMLGHKAYEDLFQERQAIGAQVKLDGERYTVVGVLEKRVRFGSEQGNQVLIPYTTAQKRITGTNHLGVITLFIEQLQMVEEVAETVRRVLRRRHEHGDEFRVETSKQRIEQFNKVVGVMKMVAGGIAGLSLLVGGIGIMNIMLVSVTERTREIGIRKALGAKPQHILFQFLAEAVVLCLAGGLIGVGGGMAFGLGIEQLIHHFDANSPFVSAVGLDSILVSLGFATVVGLFFGVYPAFRASRLDPVEALHYE